MQVNSLKRLYRLWISKSYLNPEGRPSLMNHQWAKPDNHGADIAADYTEVQVELPKQDSS